MKTQIISLDAHDDYISARDKISWTQTGRILLVWPERGVVLSRYLDLVLLLRHTTLMGAQLALVTQDPQVRYHARQLGIPVFRNLSKAQRSRWRPGRRYRTQFRLASQRRDRPSPDFEKLYTETHPQGAKWLMLPLTRSLFFTLGVFALLAIASILLPEAQITIQPRSQAQAVELIVKASPDFQSVNISGYLPVQYRKIVVEGRASITVTGSARAPQKYALGEILLTNLSDRDIPISEGTVVRTQDSAPIRFTLARAGEVPGGVGNSTSFPIRAVLPGSASNVPAGKLVAVEGPQALNLVAINEAPTRGGSDITVPAPSTADREKLYSNLESELRHSAQDQLQAHGQGEDFLISSGMLLTQVFEENYDPPALQPSEVLDLQLRLEYQVPVIASSDLLALAEAVLDANLETGFHPLADTIEISHLTPPLVDKDKSFTWKLKAERTLEAQISNSHLISLVIGSPLQSAADKLAASLPVENPPLITITPGWWPRLPYLPFRIQVRPVD